MKPFILFATLFLASTCSASLYGGLSSQYYTQDLAGSYAYGYADPNSQKHEVRAHDGTTKGSYSYVDGYGHVQSVSYIADPHSGFHATGTNLPQGPAPAVHVAVAPVAYASYAAPYAHHVPLTPHGVPVDTPEVQHAKAAHFAAHAAARAGGHHHLYKRSLWGGHGYAPQHVPVIHNGVPVDTPEVQHAKAAHLAAHAKALVHAGPIGPAVGHAGPAYHGHAYNGPIHVPVIHNGVPVDTPAVQHARASHLAALSEASSRGGYGGDDGAYYGGAGAGHYAPAHGPIHIPVIHNGVPVDTPEVQHAKAAHLAALAEANSRSYGHGGYDDGSYGHGGYDDGSYGHGHGW